MHERLSVERTVRGSDSEAEAWEGVLGWMEERRMEERSDGVTE